MKNSKLKLQTSKTYLFNIKKLLPISCTLAVTTVIIVLQIIQTVLNVIQAINYIKEPVFKIVRLNTQLMEQSV